MDDRKLEMSGGTYEEIFHEYEITIAPNPDHYRGGFEWSVCKDACELECDLAFTAEDALAQAHKAIKNLEVNRPLFTPETAT